MQLRPHLVAALALAAVAVAAAAVALLADAEGAREVAACEARPSFVRVCGVERIDEDATVTWATLVGIGAGIAAGAVAAMGRLTPSAGPS